MPLAAIRSRFAALVPLAPPVAGHVPATPCELPRCVTCGRPADTPFCPHCGERRAADRVYTLHALAAEVWDHVTPADGRVVRSLWTLVRRPGALTVAYMNGVRQPFLAPLGVFFAVNAGYFAYVSATGANTFTTPLRIQVDGTFHGRVATALVRRRLAERHTTYTAYAQRFDAVAAGQAKTLVVAMVPGFALLLAAVHLRRRRPPLHHVAFALHVTAVFLIVLMALGIVSGLVIALASTGFGVQFTPQETDVCTSLGVVGVFAVWLAPAFRRAYGDGRFAGALKAVCVAFLAFGVVVSAYRALLFFTTFWVT